jgi:5'-nucleotidase
MRCLTRSVTAAIAAATSISIAHAGPETFRLTVLHSNDGESKLLSPGPGLADFGGIARFKTLVDTLRAAAEAEGGVVMLSSGDNFLAGPEFNASLVNGVPFYDAVGMQLVGYDATCIGNHEFDFGPGVFADFVSSFSDGTPFLSSNLDYAGEPGLVALEKADRLAKSVVVEAAGRQIGLVGATTPDLPFISSPGNVIADPNVKDSVQAEIDALTAQGVGIIILMTHLQGIGTELTLIPQLRDVDIVIAGGGDELLANPGTLLVPDDAVDSNGDGVPDLVFGPYPLTAVDADGKTVRVITTRGDYRYVGRLEVDFDADGTIVAVDPASGPVRVAGGSQPDAVLPDPEVDALVTQPVAASVAGLAQNIVASSDVPLNGQNAQIRSRETNLGNLCADSLLWQAAELAKANSLPIPQIGIQNGGGIRNNSIIPAGPLSELTTFSILPFANFVVVIPEVPAATIKALLENAVARVSPPPGFPTGGTGRFAQIAGFTFAYEVDVPPGQRVLSVVLDDGTILVEDGTVVPGAPAVNVATINFLATGGDQYPLNGLPFENLSVSYQQALRNYLVGPLGGAVTALEYPVGGEGRIVRIDNPADLDNNSVINAADLSILLGQWGTGGSADLDGDGMVSGSDLAILLSAWSA